MRRVLSHYSMILLVILQSIGLVSGCQNQTEPVEMPLVSNTASKYATLTATADASKESTRAIATPVTSTIRLLMAEVNSDRVLNDLRKLTGEEPICTLQGCYTINDRETGSEGLQWAKDYVYEELMQLGYEVELQNWSHSGYSDQNVIARKVGIMTPDEEIYFVSHLDGVNPEGAERSPAADDDASGVVSLLEVARILSDRSLNRTVVLLFSTGEEHGALGARSYVDQLSLEELNSIQYVVSVEMLGFDTDGDGVMQLWAGDHAPSLAFAQMLSEVIWTYHLNLTPRIITGCT